MIHVGLIVSSSGVPAFCRLVFNATKDYVLSILMIAGLVSLVLALTFGENKRVGKVVLLLLINSFCSRASDIRFCCNSRMGRWNGYFSRGDNCRARNGWQ